MPRGIDYLLSTSSDIVASFYFFTLDTDCLSIDRLHVNRHVILFKRVIELNGGLLTYLSGDVVVLELEDVVVALVIFIGLMSCLGLSKFLGYVLGKCGFDHTKPHPEHSNAMETQVRFDIVALYPRVV